MLTVFIFMCSFISHVFTSPSEPVDVYFVYTQLTNPEVPEHNGNKRNASFVTLELMKEKAPLSHTPIVY